MTAINDVLEELKPHTLTRVHGRQPTHRDLEIWLEECANIATKIKTRLIQGGPSLGHLAIVIPEDEYQLEIDDVAWTYTEPEDPGAYNVEITGDEEDYIIRRMEAEHKVNINDYQKYLGVTEHLRNQFEQCMDSTWIAQLKKPRGGFANVTVKQFFEHLRANVTDLTSKQEIELKKEIEMDWDVSRDIKEYFTKMEQKQETLEGWGVQVTAKEIVLAAVVQMQDSGLFDQRFLRDWEMKTPAEKTWNAMKTYYDSEYRAILKYGGGNKRMLETINNVNERGQMDDMSDQFADMMKDAMVGSEQINQMATSFKGATETMAEVMSRLKTAMEENKTLSKAVADLTSTNKQLSETIKLLAEKRGGTTNTGSPRGGATNAGNTGRGTNPNNERCTICGMLHGMPFNEYCWELESNKDKRPKDWTSKLNK